ncbi:MAG TPA: efflux RND transporter periplasmic adaptor subunit [Woeseiaceae bacterium]
MRTRTLVLALIVLSAVSVGVLAAVGVDDAQPAQVPLPPEVTVSEVLIREVHEWDEFTGRFESTETVEVRPRVNGYIESVHFNEGARIAKGDLLFRIDPRPFRAEVNRLTAERDRATAQLELARTNGRRAERLFQQNATSREQFDSYTTAEATAAANLAAAVAALDAAKLNLEFTRIVSPIDGRVSRALITPGNLVDSASWLTTVVSANRIYAYFDADEQTYLRYAGIARGDDTGASANKAFIGLINEVGHPHEGRLDFVDNRIDPESGTIRGRAVLENPDDSLTPGLFARIKLVGSETSEVALVDDRAIGTDLDRKFVLVVDENNVAQYRAVSIGRQVDGLRIVSDGLAEGDVVIVNGLQRVRPGTPVTAQLVAMADLARPALGQVIAAADSKAVPLASRK